MKTTFAKLLLQGAIGLASTGAAGAIAYSLAPTTPAEPEQTLIAADLDEDFVVEVEPETGAEIPSPQEPTPTTPPQPTISKPSPTPSTPVSTTTAESPATTFTYTTPWDYIEKMSGVCVADQPDIPIRYQQGPLAAVGVKQTSHPGMKNHGITWDEGLAEQNYLAEQIWRDWTRGAYEEMGLVNVPVSQMDRLGAGDGQLNYYTTVYFNTNTQNVYWELSTNEATSLDTEIMEHPAIWDTITSNIDRRIQELKRAYQARCPQDSVIWQNR